MTAVACSFFAYLQNRAYESLEDVSEEDVINFFIEDGHPRYETSSRYRLSEFLETVADEYPVCLKIKNWLPYIRVTRKNIQYLTDEEVQIIKDVCMDIGSPLSYQIRAVVMILLYTGLRSCDIAALKLSSIDWEKEVIHVVQSKTDVPLTIPMHVHAGNAIYDYITKERKSGSEYLFVTKKNIQFKSGDVSYCVTKLFKVARIRQNKTDRKGTHIFRHYLATKLLENEVAQPVISQTLGHTDPVSVQSYLSADIKHLRECSLSIEDYPLNWEVFDYA
jgi:integrase